MGDGVVKNYPAGYRLGHWQLRALERVSGKPIRFFFVQVTLQGLLPPFWLQSLRSPEGFEEGAYSVGYILGFGRDLAPPPRRAVVQLRCHFGSGIGHLVRTQDELGDVIVMGSARGPVAL